MRKVIREMKKIYGDSMIIYNPSKKPKLSIEEICNTASMGKGMTLEKLMES